MKVRHFLYNAFLIEDGNTKIAIDPGQNLWVFKLTSLIPKEEWKGITHIVVTHGDPDHYWQADRVAAAVNAPLIMSNAMVKQSGPETLILGPRSRGVQFIPYEGKVIPIDIHESINVDGVKISGIKTIHGPIEFTILGRKKRTFPGPEERAGFGSLGFKITINTKSIVNLGDSLLQKEWDSLNPDVLMLPIGGMGDHTWTMDVCEAVDAVRLISPRFVIPCHYNVPFFWKKKMAPADEQRFKHEVEKLGVKCAIMRYGDSIEL